MSQKTGKRTKRNPQKHTGVSNKKTINARERELKKRRMQNWVWILAGCIVFGGILGFLVGKYYLYPSYREKEQEKQANILEYQQEWNNDTLMELNEQIEEDSMNLEKKD